MDAFLRGHAAGQAEVAQQQEQEARGLQQMVLKHELQRLKVQDALSDYQAKYGASEAAFNAQQGAPAASFGTTAAPITPVAPPPPSALAPTDEAPEAPSPAPMAANAPPGPTSFTSVPNRPAPIAFPGLPAEVGGGSAGFSRTPRTAEDLNAQAIALKRAEMPAVTTPPGGVTSQVNPATGQLEPVVTNTNLPPNASLDAHLLDAVTRGDVGKQRSVLATMSAAARAKGQSLPDQYASAIQDGDDLKAKTLLGAMTSVAQATKDPAVQAQLATMRALEIAIKQSQLPGAAGGATPLGVNGDEAIKDLSPDQQNTVKALANYRVPLPTGRALTSPYWQTMLSKTLAYDPTFDVTQYGARQKLRNDFTSGKGAANIRSLNTAVGHLDTLQQAGTQLANGSIPLWNSIANKGLTAIGDPRAVKFNTAANAVESELATVFKGTGASDQEIKAWRSTLNDAQSPAQLKGAIDQAIELMNSRLSALQSQWETGMGGPKDFQILNDKSKQIIGRLTGGSAAAVPAGAAGTGAPVAAAPPKAPAGWKYVAKPGGGWTAVEDQ